MAEPGLRDGRPRHVAGTTVLAVVLFLYVAAWLVIGLFHVWAHPIAGWLPLPVMSALAVHACWQVQRRPDLPSATRRFWAQLSAGCVGLTLAMFSNMDDALGHGPVTQYMGPRTLGIYLALVVLIMWALLRLPSWQRSAGDWARFALDASVMMVTTGALAWHFTLRKANLWAADTGSTLPLLTVCAVAVICVLTFIKVAFAGAGQIDRKSLHILSGGVGLAAATGGITPLLADRPYLSSTIIAGAASSLSCLLAARRQLRAYVVAPNEQGRRRFSVLPYLAVGATGGLLLLVVAPRGGETLVVAVCVVVLTLLVIVRQITALRDNSQLLSTNDTHLGQLRAYQKQLAHQVTHDALTSIANRSLFAVKVTGKLAEGAPFRVALIDLDDFKTVNDRLGHGVGDGLLKAVSRRLLERLGPGDTLARQGGDEFTLLLSGYTDEDAALLLSGLVEAVGQPIALDGHELVCKLSIGVTASQPGDTNEELLRRADVAMYAAKNAGGGRWTPFDPIMDRLADADARLAADLRQAITRDELFVLYQPIVELPHGGLAGVEALVRWRHPEHGLVSPAVFIPLAERNGYIIELGAWVLEQVVRQAAEWERTYGENAPEKVSVNISARQLREPGFPARVAELVLASGLTPHRLVAEVTETAVMGTGEALDAVRELAALGLRVALDDFGTGQSSLSLLVDCPVTVLKVDKSFVDGVTINSPQAVIVDGLIGITDGLRIDAVAEGVETAAQAERLHRVGYRFAQGFHFARPMPGEDIALLLSSQPVGTSTISTDLVDKLGNPR